MISRYISKSQSAKLATEISDMWGFNIPRCKNMKIYDITSDAQLIAGEITRVLYRDQIYIPFLSDISLLEEFPTVVVDAGAIRFVCNGADIMRPGIESHDTFDSNQIVTVSERRGKYLAVGTATIDSTSLVDMERGSVVKNLHYISDRYWKAGKSI